MVISTGRVQMSWNLRRWSPSAAGITQRCRLWQITALLCPSGEAPCWLNLRTFTEICICDSTHNSLTALLLTLQSMYCSIWARAVISAGQESDGRWQHET